MLSFKVPLHTRNVGLCRNIVVAHGHIVNSDKVYGVSRRLTLISLASGLVIGMG